MNKDLENKIIFLTAALTESLARENQRVQLLIEASVASCNCMTKTPDVKYHSPTCPYRKIQEALSIPLDNTILNKIREQDRNRVKLLMKRPEGWLSDSTEKYKNEVSKAIDSMDFSIQFDNLDF